MTKTATKETPGKGHNSKGEKLTAFVTRVENLELERESLADDIKTVLESAEKAGFDKKHVRAIVKIRKDKDQFEKDLEKIAGYMADMGEQFAFTFGGDAFDEITAAA